MPLNYFEPRSGKHFPGQILPGGLGFFKFTGSVVVISAEEQVGAAVAALRNEAARADSAGCIGFDTENVAFVNGHGTNSNMAAIAQFCATPRTCYIFLIHLWKVVPKFFLEFLEDRTQLFAALNPSHDVNFLTRRLMSLSSTSAAPRTPPAISGILDIVKLTSGAKSVPASLEGQVRTFTDMVLDKRINHEHWEAPTLSAFQQQYAAADAAATLTSAACAAACISETDDGYLVFHAVVPQTLSWSFDDDGAVTLECPTFPNGAGAAALMVARAGDIIRAVSTVGFPVYIIASEVVLYHTPTFLHPHRQVQQLSKGETVQVDIRRWALPPSPFQRPILFLRIRGTESWLPSFSEDGSVQQVRELIFPPSSKEETARILCAAASKEPPSPLFIEVSRPKGKPSMDPPKPSAKCATYRHEKPTKYAKSSLRPVDGRQDLNILDSDTESEDSDIPSDDDALGDGDELSEKAPAGEVHREAAAAAQALTAAMAMIRHYVKSGRADDLTFTTKFSTDERKALHYFCDEFGLNHRSHGPEGDRQVQTQ